MPDFVVRVTRVRRVVQQADIRVAAGSAHHAESLVSEMDPNGWVTIDGETMHRNEKALGIKVPNQVMLDPLP